MFKASIRMTALALAATLSPAAPAVAQKLSISPTIGVYIPTSELLKAANGDEFKQEIGLAVGGRLGSQLQPAVRHPHHGDLRAERSQARPPPDPAGEEQSQPALWLRSGDVHVIPVTSPVWLSINGGGSLRAPERRRLRGRGRHHDSAGWSARRSASGWAAC